VGEEANAWLMANGGALGLLWRAMGSGNKERERLTRAFPHPFLRSHILRLVHCCSVSFVGQNRVYYM
jgi:hypothetical protein